MNHKFTATVEKGRQEGRKIGFPTANLQIPSAELEIYKPGIYSGYAFYKDQKYRASIYLGKSETFNESALKLEVFIHDFNQDIYDQSLTVELVNFIRSSTKFKTLENLKIQIAKDILETEKLPLDNQ